MKKRLLLALLAVAVICATVVCLVACGPTENSDKSFQNAEFVGFRKKIVTILKDNGIYVNDLDSKQRNASVSTNAKFKVASTTRAINAFDEIMAKPAYLASSADFDFALKQVFGLSLKMSLCLGDGISNYFGEKEFFDIPVKIGDSYMSVSESGDVNTVRAYYNSEYGEDLFDIIEMEYKSATNYTFTSRSIGDARMFASGNAQKQFIMIYVYGNGGDVVYSPNGTTFYATSDDAALNACLDALGDGAFDIDKEEFYANKSNVRYTFSEEQNQTLTDKYFKDIQSSASYIQGLVTVTKGGITYADFYQENESNSIATIPSGTQYISKDFVVYDVSGTLTTLYIPKSVIGVVQTHDEKTGAELDTPQIVPASELKIELAGENNGQSVPKAFESISVEHGSSLFKSGTGHLQTADGEYIYLIDAPIDTFDFDMFNEHMLNVIKRSEDFGYSNLYFTVDEIDIDLDKDYILETISPLLKNLSTLNISGTYSENNKVSGLTVNVLNNMTVNIDIADSFKFHGRPISLNLISADNNRHSVTVNLIGLTCIDEVFSDNLTVTVNMGMPKLLYEVSGIHEPNPCDGVHYVYPQSTITEEQANNFGFFTHTRSGQLELGVYLNGTAESLRMPEEVGFDVTALSVVDSDWTNEIYLNSKIKYILCEKQINSTRKPVLVYGDTIAKFEEQVQIICYGESYSFTVRCSNGTKTYSGTTTIPDDELCHVTLKIYDSFGKLITKTVPAAKGKPFHYVWYIDVNEAIPDCDYIALSGSNTTASVQYTDRMWVNSDPENEFTCHYASIDYGTYGQKLTGDETFTLVQFDAANEPEQITISQDGFECHIQVYWSSAVVNVMTTTYNGVEIYPTSNASFTMPEKFIYEFSNNTVTLNVKVDYKLTVENGKLTFKADEVKITASQNH